MLWIVFSHLELHLDLGVVYGRVLAEAARRRSIYTVANATRTLLAALASTRLSSQSIPRALLILHRQLMRVVDGLTVDGVVLIERAVRVSYSNNLLMIIILLLGRAISLQAVVHDSDLGLALYSWLQLYRNDTLTLH